jgi:hypothetical protein
MAQLTGARQSGQGIARHGIVLPGHGSAVEAVRGEAGIAPPGRLETRFLAFPGRAVERITTAFETRLVDRLKAELTEAEQSEIYYELGPAPYPALQPDGSQGVNMGMSISLATRAAALTDHVMVTGLVQDPFCPDHLLEINVREMIAGLRERRAASGATSNGGLIVPGRMPS